MIQNTLVPTQTPSTSTSMALFGMGGVGKTQLALYYAHHSSNRFGIILWIAADNAITIGQNSREASPWLIVSDNAEDLQALKVAWPGGSHGSILLITRDFDVARNPAAECLRVDPFDSAEGSVILLRQIGLDLAVTANSQHAIAITESLGGLPLL
ncbi:Uu.00g084630.m01.CDS01 [Anthostomella pinea]|uniref:Uu.00g084630.m01.CDS01 n=1 Tax=Anthostomella pinea TaxID=933095 RepID=A0AAI8YJR5_9PEZI|nr:Uu.00g084630.m01.CDS01 [Anthostomella pinea]